MVSYLYRRNAVYYFRRRIPEHLKDVVPIKEVNQSLKTTNTRLAKLRADLVSFRLNQLFTKEISEMADIRKVKALVKKYIDEAIQEYSDLEDLRHQYLAYVDDNGDQWAGHSTPAINREVERIGQILQHGDQLELQTNCNAILKRSNITENDLEALSSKEKEIFTYELLKGETEVLLYDKDRNQDRISGSSYIPNDRSFFDDPDEAENEHMLKEIERHVSSNQPEGIKFSDAINKFIDSEYEGRGWNEKTKNSVESKLHTAMWVLGDRIVNDFRRPDFTYYRKVLLQLPSNMKKHKKFDGKRADEVIAINTYPTLDKSTANTYISWLQSFFEWAFLEHYADANRCTKLKFKIDTKKQDNRKPLDDRDLQELYHQSPIFSEKAIQKMRVTRPERFWIVLISLFSSMRLEEIAQLHTEDLYEINGVWIFDVNENPNKHGEKVKKVKNKPSIRKIPIHPFLIELGFLEYFEQIKQKREERLWPHLERKRDGYGRNIGDWFNREFKRHVTANEKKSFHSCRHTFIQRLKNLSVDEHKLKAITGHGEDSTTYQVYGDEFSPDLLLPIIEQVHYSVFDKINSH